MYEMHSTFSAATGIKGLDYNYNYLKETNFIDDLMFHIFRLYALFSLIDDPRIKVVKLKVELLKNGP